MIVTCFINRLINFCFPWLYFLKIYNNICGGGRFEGFFKYNHKYKKHNYKKYNEKLKKHFSGGVQYLLCWKLIFPWTPPFRKHNQFQKWFAILLKKKTFLKRSWVDMVFKPRNTYSLFNPIWTYKEQNSNVVSFQIFQKKVTKVNLSSYLH